MTQPRFRRVAVAAIGCVLIPAAVVMACTGFLATGNDGVLFGNNEDFFIAATKMWFVTGENGGYGAVYFGFDDMVPQGSMNEAGLAFDGFATRLKPVTGSLDRESFGGSLISKVMAECATVDEVLEVLGRYNLAMMARFMWMFADATGDSVIVEGDQIIRKSGAFQLITNFYQSEDPAGAHAYGLGKRCVRFEIANDMLKGAETIDIQDARNILNAVHQEGRFPTLYSNIYDLDDRLVYIYNFHDFTNEVVIDLAEELKKGPRVVDLPSLFPRSFAQEAYVISQLQAIEKRREERGSVELPVGILERYTGKYKSPIGVIAVTVDGGGLVSVQPDLSRTRLTPTSDTAFYELSLSGDLDVEFRLSADGTVEGAHVKLSRTGLTFMEEFLERLD